MKTPRPAFRRCLATLCVAAAILAGGAASSRACDFTSAGHQAYNAHDWTKALPLLKAATARGNACAEQTLGVMYYGGFGTPPDQARGRGMWLDSFAQGNINAALPLAIE
jgi:TPR repeat protein